MKKVFVFLALTAMLSACSSYKNATGVVKDYLVKHDAKESHVFNPVTGETKFHGSIDSLYDFSKVAELCDTADITLHISRGSIVVDATCDGAGQTFVEMLQNLWANIQFRK